MKHLLIAIVFTLAVVSSSAAEPTLPDTPAGKMAAAFIEAFNSGEEAMVAFHQEWTSPAQLERMPMAERARMYKSLVADVGQIRLVQVLRESDRGISLLVVSSTEERLELQLLLDLEDPRYMGGVMLDEAPPEDEMLATDDTPMTEAAMKDSINAFVDGLLAEDSFSGVVHITRGDRVVYSRAAGMAERRFDVPVMLDTKFNVGSISKMWTTVAIAQLASAGKLNVDDTVDKHLPDFPRDVASRITIQQLVDHTSGLGDIFGDHYDAIDKSSLRSISDFVELFKDDPLQFEPGEDRAYSNAGYTLLGAIMERISGEAYDEYMRKNVFEPAGMMATGSLAADKPIKNMATGYTRRPRPDQLTTADKQATADKSMGGGHHDSPQGGDKTWELRSNAYSLPGLSSSAGGGYSTVGDMVRFAAALREDRLLPPGWTQWVLRKPAPTVGADVRPTMEVFPHGSAIGIAGGAQGINALHEIYLNPSMNVVILANMDPPIAERMGRQMRGWVKRAGLVGEPEVAASK